MIDTVVLRLHDIRKYDLLIRRLRLKKNKGYTLKSASIDIENAQRMRNMGFRKPREMLQIMELNRTGEFLVKTEVNKQVNSSKHYAFAWRIDHTNDYIEFNFSIPKYKFGSNVLQWVEHLHDVYFQYTRNRTLLYNMRKTVLNFKTFIDGFLASEFVLDKIDLRDLEVNRIDVCYNQVFKSKPDAIAYFNYQKRLNKKYSREDDGGKTDYDTSFMYKTKRSSCKIYHKGTEYQKNDLREHLKINNDKGYEYFKTKKFQELADKILRYEVTIRSAEFNYLFKHNIFRKDCPAFKTNYRNYIRIENTIIRNNRLSKKIGKLPDSEKHDYRLLHPYEKISSEDRQTHKYVAELMNRKPYFMMKVDMEENEYNLISIENLNFYRAEFSKQLLWLCLKKLYRFIKEFQIKELPMEEQVGLLIDIYNSSHRAKLQKSSMINFYLLLIEYGSFKEAARFARKDRATMFRYKKRFKAIGITENHVNPDKSYSIPQPAIDFNEYHTFLERNNLLRSIKIH